MATTLPSAEVAADFQDYLQDLQMNNRYEISNLTLVAKENTEHAMAISRVLETHIKTTPPARKLPSLYVLDSIVKNVGTPYTIYLGRNLYSTFMDAYTLVDNQTRKNMEAMLKTWKEPVPGSMDTRPVFPPEVTRTIENALIKARTVFVQQQQQQARSQRQTHALPPRPLMQSQDSWRNTPPPQGMSSVAFQPHGLSFLIPPAQPSPLPVHPANYPPPPAYPLHNLLSFAQNTDEILTHDLESLVQTARNEFVTNPYDVNVQTKLKALLDLQTILKSQQVPSDQKLLIKEQVRQLSEAAKAARLPQRTISPTPVVASTPQPFVPPPPPPINISTDTLAQLLASTQPARNPTPTIPQATPMPQYTGLASLLAPPPVPPTLQVIHQQPAVENSLMASLRAAGLLPANAPNSGSFAVPQPPGMLALPFPPQQFQLPRPPVNLAQPVRPALAEVKNDVQLTTASLKIPRPHLLDSLYAQQPSQCSTCGRRFPATEAGRARKARHLDLHFRTNQRLVDAARRGVSRSWYVDELEWIRFREVDDGDETLDAAENGNGTGAVGGSSGEGHGFANVAADGGAQSIADKARSQRMARYVKAPADAASGGYHCPICQDSFEMVWHDAAQEWVWMDAVNAGGRVFHATCRDEVAKDESAFARSTPEPSVLGKRKAEDEGGSRLKRETIV